MSRFDKYEPHVGGFRARLNAAWLLADVGLTRAVALNASGRVVKGNPVGASGLRGLIALGKIRNAGHPVDVMTSGEILDITAADIAGTIVAGAPVFAIRATGALTMVATSNFYVGHLVETDRLIVRCTFDITAGA